MDGLIHLVYDINVFKHGGYFVIRKMLSNLALLYIYHFKSWRNPLTNLAASLVSKQPVLDGTSMDLPLEFKQIMINFSQIVAEELIKKEVASTAKAQLHQSVYQNVFVVVEGMLLNSDQEYLSLHADTWMECFVSWVNYASKAEFNSTVRYNFTPLLSELVGFLSTSLAPKALETLVEAMDINSTFFTSEVKDSLHQFVFGGSGVELLQNDPDLSSSFAQLVILLIEMDMVSFCYHINDQSDTKFDLLLHLTNFSGIPIVEETISNDFIDFWMQMSDTFSEDHDRFESMLDHDTQAIKAFDQKATDLLLKVSQIYWSKIHIPDDLEGFKNEFRVYRRDVGDLFVSISTVVKFQLYEGLVSTISQTLETSKNLGDIEASLYLINALNEDYSEDNVSQHVIDCVTVLFKAGLLNTVVSNRTQGKFEYFVYTTVRFVASVDWFYKSESGASFLSDILNFLFECMTSSKNYQLTSSRAIADICDECRDSLKGSAQNLLQFVSNSIGDPEMNALVKERLVNSCASIIQGMKEPEEQGSYLFTLFSAIGRAMVKDMGQLDTCTKKDEKPLKDYLIGLISSVSSIGKGMQLPDEPSEVYGSEQELARVNKYWNEDPHGIHSQILEIIQGFTLSPKLSDNLEVAEEISNIFKSGLTESVAGPFVFAPAVITKFILAKFESLRTFKTYPIWYELYSKVIKASYRKMDPESVQLTVQHICIEKEDIIKTDPDMIQAVLRVYSTILSTKPSLLTGNLEPILNFAVNQLVSQERFVLKSLQQFWTTVIYLRRGTRQDTMVIRRLFNETQLGSTLTYQVLKNMLKIERSNLEYFTEILKALVSKYPMLIERWMNSSFEKLNSKRSKPIQYELFVKKMLVTRGMRPANGLIKNFWLEVNGLVNYGGV